MTSWQYRPFLTYQETQITKLVKVTVEKLQWEKYDCVISLNYFVRYKGIGVLVGGCDLSYISALLAKAGDKTLKLFATHSSKLTWYLIVAGAAYKGCS